MFAQFLNRKGSVHFKGDSQKCYVFTSLFSRKLEKREREREMIETEQATKGE